MLSEFIDTNELLYHWAKEAMWKSAPGMRLPQHTTVVLRCFESTIWRRSKNNFLPERNKRITTNMNNIPQIFFSTTTTSSIFLPVFLFIFSIFIYFFYQRRPDSIPPPSRSRKNETKYVDAAIERALEMRSIVSKMPSDSPHIPERGLDYRTKRNIVLENRWWWNWWIWRQRWCVCMMMLRSCDSFVGDVPPFFFLVCLW